MAEKKLKIAVGMSGGVDSSYAAFLLKQQGHEVVGITMAIFEGDSWQGDATGHACYGPSEDNDIRSAKQVCALLDIPHHTFDLRAEYREAVLSYFTNEYLRGRTPNPCTRCNPLVKFGFLLEKARAQGMLFDHFATGHYARVGYDQERRRWVLMRGLDRKKDQSYFLYGLKPQLLSSLLFPLGELTKQAVREGAARARLPSCQRPESQNFVEAEGYGGLFAGERVLPGPILDVTGKKLGTHNGIVYYTVGQRRGIGVAGKEPLYVLGIDAPGNAVTVGPKERLFARELTVSEAGFLAIDPPPEPIRAQAQIRHNGQAADGLLSYLGNRKIRFVFDQPQLSVTPGSRRSSTRAIWYWVEGRSTDATSSARIGVDSGPKGRGVLVFLAGLTFLLGGYFMYGGLMDRSLRPDPDRVTPAMSRPDGVDFVPMPTWRVYLIQLLNIAGLGPVFGPIMGALWGPQVFLWIVLGAVLGGAVHDYLSGAMSLRNNGAGLPDLIGHYLGRPARHLAVSFILLLMVLVGTVFVRGPAALVVSILPAETVAGWFGAAGAGFLGGTFQGLSIWMWMVMAAIFVYYLLATLLPIDKLIGRFYPFFALALLIMVVGLAAAVLTGRLSPPAFTLANLHPRQTPAWPIIFITVSCGAISGFHATQSPMMARCLKSERNMRLVFYGAMIAEGLIALVWATAAQSYYGGIDGLAAALGPRLNNATVVVHDICTGVMGPLGGLLAIVGVVVLPITSGDTAFRVSRLILADYFQLPQSRVLNRYRLAIPLFAISLALNFIPFGLLWRYFGWANQTLAAVTLWSGAVFLARRGKAWWLAAMPAAFMTVMTTTYILVESRENGCLGLSHGLGTGLGLAMGAAALGAFLWARPRLQPESETSPLLARPTEAEKKGDGVAC